MRITVSTSIAAVVPAQLRYVDFIDDREWRRAVRGRPDAGVLAEAAPRAHEVLRAVPTGAKPLRLGKKGAVVAGYLAKPARFSTMSADQRFRMLRFVELVRIADHRVRHGIGLKADPWLRAMASVSDAETLSRWARDFLPDIGPAEVDDAIEKAGRERYTAQEIGDLIGLTIEEREGIDVRTVRPGGMSRRTFEDYARERTLECDRRRDEERRRAAGVKPRRKGESAADEAEREGCSIATIYRRRARAKAEAEEACEVKPRQVHQEDMAEFRLARPRAVERHATPGQSRKAFPLIFWPRFFSARSGLISTRAPLTASNSPADTGRLGATIALRADADRLTAWMRAMRRAA